MKVKEVVDDSSSKRTSVASAVVEDAKASIFRENADPGVWLSLLLPLASSLAYARSENPSASSTAQGRTASTASEGYDLTELQRKPLL
jgi:hypothetical protein